MSKSPVFYDPDGKRRRWSQRGLILTIVLIVLAAIGFATTVLEVVPATTPAMSLERPQPLPLGVEVNQAERRVRRALWRWFPRRHQPGDPLTLGFYVPWDNASAESLRTHMDQLDWVVPALATVNGPEHKLNLVNDPHYAYLMATARTHPRQLIMVQNLNDGAWESDNVAALVKDPRARAKLVGQLRGLVANTGWAGLTFDFESIPKAAIPGYVALLAETHRALAPLHKLVAVTLPADDPSWPIERIAAATDRIILMNYDQHWQSGPPGPIAAQPWFVQQLRAILARAPAAKVIVAVGSYAYDWHAAPGEPDNDADVLTIEEALAEARDSDTTPTFDAESGNQRFSFSDQGQRHDVWMMDAAVTWNQLEALKAAGINSVALWRLGSEDPGIWNSFAAWRSGQPGQRPDLSTITPATDVDVEGNGEILRIASTPQTGNRVVSYGPDGLVHNIVYQTLPSPYVVQRTGGGNPKLLALTFDDGPDSTWTPRILDILESRHVPGTFFVVGENAVTNAGLLQRMIAGGSEIGNHSYTHPNMAQVSSAQVKLEFNATQRVIQAYTGYGTRLFRAPYFGDAEPTTADEIDPALVAQKAGYVIVGLHVDTEDWQRPGTEEIYNAAISQVLNPEPGRSANVILLHDGGGDRSETVAALPRIIDTLRAHGYTFVPVSTLAGVSRATVMPKIANSDLAAVRFDVGMFRVLATIEIGLTWMFFLAIGLGTGRAILMATLAVTGRNRTPPPPMPAEPPHVSVIIPAYNEERVIEASVRRVLASEGVTVEVIVADDGSSDRTSAIVAEAFGDDPRVRLLTLANGGKAAALNRAMTLATAPIVVALDADTQFEKLTIARLARWFVDPRIGGVAGNAKVGNRFNLVTRWQAVEYVTSQNVERRALARFDAMMVIPGAVGAWRRLALDSVGGYPADTLAEDQDLTIAIQRKGWRVAYDVEAIAWTEAPETFRALAKQRYRWAFGTLQCLWKHGRLVFQGRPAGLALVGVPQTWLFQILFAAISPLIDLALVYSIFGTLLRISQHGWYQTQTDVIRMGVYWLVFTSIDLLCGWVAYKLEARERKYPALLLLMQRFVYRQLMYWVVLRAITSAVAGMWVGWGKLERSGRADVREQDVREQAG